MCKQQVRRLSVMFFVATHRRLAMSMRRRRASLVVAAIAPDRYIIRSETRHQDEPVAPVLKPGRRSCAGTDSQSPEKLEEQQPGGRTPIRRSESSRQPERQPSTRKDACLSDRAFASKSKESHRCTSYPLEGPEKLRRSESYSAHRPSYDHKCPPITSAHRSDLGAKSS